MVVDVSGAIEIKKHGRNVIKKKPGYTNKHHIYMTFTDINYRTRT